MGQSLCSQPLLAPIAAGYITKIIIISCIVYAGIHEWKEMKAREVEVRGINRQRHDMNDIYVEMLSLSLLCETFMEWNEQDFLTFRKRKQHIDSLLYEFNNSNPNSHMDSIRTLWKDKELYMQKSYLWCINRKRSVRKLRHKFRLLPDKVNGKPIKGGIAEEAVQKT